VRICYDCYLKQGQDKDVRHWEQPTGKGAMGAARTFVVLEVSREAYLEIYNLLAGAGYHHVFIDGAIDMHGIALTMRGKDGELLSTPVCDHASWRCMCEKGKGER
jgi:hypothetical protein